MTKGEAIAEFEATLRQGVAQGKITTAHLFALKLLLDAQNRETPEQLLMANVAIKPF